MKLSIAIMKKMCNFFYIMSAYKIILQWKKVNYGIIYIQLLNKKYLMSGFSHAFGSEY